MLRVVHGLIGWKVAGFMTELRSLLTVDRCPAFQYIKLIPYEEL